MLIPKSKMFRSKRLRDEVISDDQVMYLSGNFGSAKLFEKVV